MVQAVVAWLEERLQDGSPAAAQLPLFYLQRSRLHQALQSYDKLKNSGMLLCLGGAEACSIIQQLSACCLT